jgi:small-conductance mechanosensitive channel
MQKMLKLAVLSLLILFFIPYQNSFAQEKKKVPRTARERERKSMRSRDSVFEALSKSDTSISSLLQHVEQYTTSFNQINNSLAEGLDTTEVSEKLPLLVRRIAKIKSLANTKKSSTLRYLFVLRDNLDHAQDMLDGWQSDLDNVNTKLVQNQHDILQFPNDPLLKTVPSDSTLRKTFFDQKKVVSVLWKKTDSTNRKNLFKVNLLQNRVATAYATVLDASDLIDSKIKKFADRAMDGEFGYIWTSNNTYSHLDSALNGTIRLNTILANYFVKSETVTHLISTLFLVIVVGWILYVRHRTLKNVEHKDVLIEHAQFIYKKPLVSALLIPMSIAPYFYDHPPVFFLECAFLITTILVLILVRIHFPLSLFRFLNQLFWLTIIYSVSNLFIQITNADRYVIFLLSIVSIIFAILFYLRTQKEPKGHLHNTQLIIKAFTLLQIISLILSITGRFSLAKIVGITAVFNLWMLISLYFVIRIIIQAVYFQFHTKRAESSFISLIDFNVLQKKFRSVLATLAALLWIFFLLQNLNIDDWVHDYLNDILTQPRTVGGASFTFGGFVIFIIVIWLSSIVSRIISFFYDLSARHANDLSVLKKKNRASTLLIRIGVFSVGFLLAVAASGFPLDKLTIIFSAFGVGIGFGLQNIVNNLVSGMILAFEKPIQIGDIIEVNNRTGTIKEIGIRSSKLATGNGSEVIIPNGDLISQNVVNWTLSNTNRQIEILISAAYGTDVQKVTTLLKDLLCNRNDIMINPEPAVFLNSITDKSVDFRVFFWAADIADFLKLKSRVLADIYDAFRKEGIQLPKT